MAISYNKTNWVNNETKLNAENLNHIEDGIKNVTDEVNKIEDGTVVAEKAYKDGQGSVIHETYETKDAANAKLTEAKTYADGKIEELDVAEAGSDGSYIEKISETNGKIAVTVQEFDSTPTNNSNKGVKSGGVKSYVDNAIADLDATEVGGNGKYVKAISETNGVISAVEETMDTTPTNGSNKAITSGAVKEYVDGTLEDYAKKDGYYETFGYAREAGIAKNLQNDEGKLLDPDVETSSGTVYADQPFTQRATAMTMKAYLDNELITVGSGYEQWRKEQAFSIVRNQYAKELINDNYYAQSTATIAYNDGVATFLANATNDAIATKPISNFCIANHRYFISCKLKLTTATNKVYLELRDGTGVLTIATTQETANEQTIMGIFEARSDYKNAYVRIIDTRTDGFDSITIYNFKIIDLTQWFASRPEIAEALNGDAGIKWFLQNYPQALTLGYDEGTIVDTEDYEYQTTGVNLWDEEWEVGSFDNKGQPIQQSTIRSKNFIEIIGNTIYYFYSGNNNWGVIYFYDSEKNLISSVERKNSAAHTPENAMYMKFRMDTSYGTTYKNDIQICNHFTETSVEQTYHKYEIFKDRVSWAFTSTGKGKSAGKAADTKDYVNKKNIEKVGRVDLGTLNWERGDSGIFYADLSTSKISGIYNCLCTKYTTAPNHTTPNNMDNMSICTGSAYPFVYVKDNNYTDATTFKTAMSGVILNYELATPIETDMTGDELDTNIPENDYGVERKVPLSGNMFSGSSTTIFYQDNVLRQIYNNKSSIDNLQEEVAAETTTRSDTDTALQNAIGGTLRQLLANKESLDFDNTDFVDLGTIEFDTTTTNVADVYRFTSTILVGVAKGSSANNTIAKCLCTKIKTNSIDNTYLCQDGIAISSNGSLSIFVQGINDSANIKTYLKGVLLAYEKASS